MTAHASLRSETPGVGSSDEREAVIRVRGLKMGFGGRVLMESLDFDVYRGETFVILGGSGSGKSTLLKHLIGLYTPMAGSIEITGLTMTGADDATREEILRRIGVMYQLGALFGSMTLLENVCLPLEVHTRLPKAARERIAHAKLEQVGLGRFASYLPSEISGGMQKRAAIARAMALDPGVLFLDEPSAGLDPITSAELDRLIRALQRDLGMTFVVVTHELPSIFTIADRVIMLDAESKGIVAEGDPATLRRTATHPWVRRFLARDGTEGPLDGEPDDAVQRIAGVDTTTQAGNDPKRDAQ